MSKIKMFEMDERTFWTDPNYRKAFKDNRKLHIQINKGKL